MQCAGNSGCETSLFSDCVEGNSKSFSRAVEGTHPKDTGDCQVSPYAPCCQGRARAAGSWRCEGGVHRSLCWIGWESAPFLNSTVCHCTMWGHSNQRALAVQKCVWTPFTSLARPEDSAFTLSQNQVEQSAERVLTSFLPSHLHTPYPCTAQAQATPVRNGFVWAPWSFFPLRLNNALAPTI